MKAWVLVREMPWYRRLAFCDGLKAAGYEVLSRQPERGRPGDVLCIWNRYGTTHEIASRFEKEGGTVLVCENGYIGAGGVTPKFSVHPGGPKPTDHYAIGLGYHNDDACWKPGGPERWAALGVELKPWRTTGEHILVLPNRSFGIPGRTMSVDWAEQAALRIGKQTARPVRIRRHPGNDQPKRPLAADLDGAWCAVVWSSSAGIHALVAGIPVFCEGPHWSMKSAAAGGTIDAPTLPDRLPAFHRLAFGQWECREIETGLPFQHLK